VSTTWLSEAHLDALYALVPYIEDRTVKRRIKELLLGLTEQYTAALSRAVVQDTLNEPITPLTRGELDAVQRLLAKGVQHNGLVPELDTLQVGRALQIVGELLVRVDAASLSQEDQAGLEWVFDVAADEDDGLNRAEVRRVERLVRAAMGLQVRMTHLSPINAQVA
jgi:hypothetical protein